MPGSGPKTEAQLLEALAREAEPRRAAALLLTAPGAGRRRRGRARRRARGRRAALARRAASCWRSSARPRTRARCSTRFAGLPQIVAVVERTAAGRRGDRRGRAGRAGRSRARALRHRAGAGDRLARVRRGARAAARRARRAVALRGDRRALVPAGAARAAVSRRAAAPARAGRHPRRPALPHDLVRRPGQRRGDGPRGARARLRVPRDLRPHAGGGRRPRASSADDVRRQGEEIAAANELLAPFRVLRGIECDILPDGRLDLPDDVLARARLGAGERARRAADAAARADQARRGRRCAIRPCAASATRRAGSSTGARERARPGAGVRGRARARGRARGQRPPDRLDLSGEHVRDALRPGVPIVCSTDAHSIRGLGNMRAPVATARRGWATAADVVNTRPLAELLASRRGPLQPGLEQRLLGLAEGLVAQQLPVPQRPDVGGELRQRRAAARRARAWSSRSRRARPVPARPGAPPPATPPRRRRRRPGLPDPVVAGVTPAR